MTIVLDPGHGGTDGTGSGAIYPPYIEKNINLEVASQVRDELVDEGIDVYMTREFDHSMSLEERAAYAGSVNADLLISLHFNSSGPHDKFGSEVWTSYTYPYFNTGVELGSSILRQITSLGFANKGVKTRPGRSGDYYGIIRHGVELGIPTIIVEHCFIDSFIDRPLFEEVGTDGLAHAVAEGIIDYVESVEGDLERSRASKRHPADSDYEYSESHSPRESSSRNKNEDVYPEYDMEERVKRNTPSSAHPVNESKTSVSVDKADTEPEGQTLNGYLYYDDM